ncbi:Tetraspanin-8 [Liparis tanakae]|uniref:Tetraspanin-8 n=1 Tax=Liparis tanakae TaxID=230148 RepID=A0A4Z2GBP3_9TELE|nr:Tetraspanin-8 [Liparis tanakae]
MKHRLLYNQRSRPLVLSGLIILGVSIYLKFFISLLFIFVLLLALGILGAVEEKRPCSTQIIELMEKHMEVVLGIAFAIAILLIFGMVFSMILYCQVGRKDTAVTA